MIVRRSNRIEQKKDARMFIWETSGGPCDHARLDVRSARAAFANFCTPQNPAPDEPAPHLKRRSRQVEGSLSCRAQRDYKHAPKAEPFCNEALKTALRGFAKSVTVVSCAHSGMRYAMTATAVSEVCLTPPTMLVCINKLASIATPLIDEGRFAINLLDISQQRISEDCSGKKSGTERFADQDWTTDYWNTPYIQNSQATIFCNVVKKLEYGTHIIVLGAVQGVRANDSVSPLIYLDRRYIGAALNTVMP